MRFLRNVSRIAGDEREVCNGCAISMERAAGDASSGTVHLAYGNDGLWPESRRTPCQWLDDVKKMTPDGVVGEEKNRRCSGERHGGGSEARGNQKECLPSSP